MAGTDVEATETAGGAFAPLREPVFRRIWTASVLSNFSQLFLGIGAQWEMTRLTDSPTMVALVQTAMMLPLMVVTLPAGAVADMFDRRKIAMTGLGFSSLAAAMLATLAFLGMTTPWVLLASCVLIGSGVALFSPSWQASIPEQVSRPNLPAAVALGTISYNVARSFGPALGGLIVLAAGAKAVFALTSVLYAPLFLAFLSWRREHVPSRLPPERIDRAIIGGGRYALHSAAIRTALVRALCFGLATATATGLAPLVAKDLLLGDAAVFGILLGAQGVGAVIGALFVSNVREHIGAETAIRCSALGVGVALVAIGLSRSLPMTCAAFFVIGACNIMTIALLNVSVQLSAPRWVTARALSLFSSALTAGIGIGAWLWGEFAGSYGVTEAFVASGCVSAALILLGLVLPISREKELDNSPIGLGRDPEVALDLTPRSGPVVVELDYYVDPEQAREFYSVMMELQRSRKRLGGFDWTLARDIADPARWTERYYCPTWGDYLRMRERYSQEDLDVQRRADAFNPEGFERGIRRRLERPFGSVRWKAETPDPHQETINYIAP
ncbi:MFS transporter [Novosphingobium sp. PC22D]|uniref:MFS transporter n=1 Tax=Novosphingobium sp. PC22D TaxID=1962403 RepID=UPI000BF12D6B|nr:MFS transporter [Novosphingobium sp. PC22D]PEQ11881.1 MFS transporter [Novosphingobium sp. PC22D]